MPRGERRRHRGSALAIAAGGALFGASIAACGLALGIDGTGRLSFASDGGAPARDGAMATGDSARPTPLDANEEGVLFGTPLGATSGWAPSVELVGIEPTDLVVIIEASTDVANPPEVNAPGLGVEATTPCYGQALYVNGILGTMGTPTLSASVTGGTGTTVLLAARYRGAPNYVGPTLSCNTNVVAPSGTLVAATQFSDASPTLAIGAFAIQPSRQGPTGVTVSADLWTVSQVTDAGPFVAVYESEGNSVMSPYAPAVMLSGSMAGDWVSITIIAVP